MKVFEHFYRKFGKFANRNEIKSDFRRFYQIFLKSHKIFIYGRIFKIQNPQKIGKPQEYIHIWGI